MTVQDWDEAAIGRRLREVGLRPTSPRRRVLAHLTSVTTHPSVDGLYEALRAAGSPVQLPTLYQNLTRLVAEGLVTRFLDEEGRMRFDANVAPHHHLLCTACGRIDDLDLGEKGAAELRALRETVAGQRTGWRVYPVQIQARGVCPACRMESDGES